MKGKKLLTALLHGQEEISQGRLAGKRLETYATIFNTSENILIGTACADTFFNRQVRNIELGRKKARLTSRPGEQIIHLITVQEDK